jgi:hypothetical protein
MEDYLRRHRAGRILELAGSGLWEGDLSEMRGADAYRTMAADERRESEAHEWAEATLRDVADEAR